MPISVLQPAWLFPHSDACGDAERGEHGNDGRTAVGEERQRQAHDRQQTDIHKDIKPEHEMEKLLYAADELTGLIGAAALMRPSKSVQDMELKSLKKKYKDKKFAAGCSREVIERGAELCGLTLEELWQQTLDAMRSCEDSINRQMEEI